MRALGSAASPDATVELVIALGDPDANVRWLVSSTLERIGGPQVVVRLLALLKCRAPVDARVEAIVILGRLGNVHARPALVQLAENVRLDQAVSESAREVSE